MFHIGCCKNGEKLVGNFGNVVRETTLAVVVVFDLPALGYLSLLVESESREFTPLIEHCFEVKDKQINK